MAQLVARFVRNEEVRGSIPLRSTERSGTPVDEAGVLAYPAESRHRRLTTRYRSSEIGPPHSEASSSRRSSASTRRSRTSSTHSAALSPAPVCHRPSTEDQHAARHEQVGPALQRGGGIGHRPEHVPREHDVERRRGQRRLGGVGHDELRPRCRSGVLLPSPADHLGGEVDSRDDVLALLREQPRERARAAPEVGDAQPAVRQQGQEKLRPRPPHRRVAQAVIGRVIEGLGLGIPQGPLLLAHAADLLGVGRHDRGDAAAVGRREGRPGRRTRQHLRRVRHPLGVICAIRVDPFVEPGDVNETFELASDADLLLDARLRCHRRANLLDQRWAGLLWGERQPLRVDALDVGAEVGGGGVDELALVDDVRAAEGDRRLREEPLDGGSR